MLVLVCVVLNIFLGFFIPWKWKWWVICPLSVSRLTRSMYHRKSFVSDIGLKPSLSGTLTTTETELHTQRTDDIALIGNFYSIGRLLFPRCTLEHAGFAASQHRCLTNSLLGSA